jgi:hypothetical protein
MNVGLLAIVCFAAALMLFSQEAGGAQAPPRGLLDPRGKIHMPIGIPNTLDSLKTFVEAEGNFSPGLGTYGIYFWLYDPQTQRHIAPTMDGVLCPPKQCDCPGGTRNTRGLHLGGHLIPWTCWKAAGVHVMTEVCEVRRSSPAGDVFVVAARVQLVSTGQGAAKVRLYAALRPLGAAGGPVREIAVSDEGDALLVDGHPALLAQEKPSGAGVLATDTLGDVVSAGKVPAEMKAASPAGDCSGVLCFDFEVPSGGKTLGFICPVLAGRRAVGHQWDGKSEWAQLDLAKPNPPEGGVLQADPGLAYYRGLKADRLFQEAGAYWKDLVGRIHIMTPDGIWEEAAAAIIGHAGIAMNDGAPDVAVVNYNVFNRDGAYTANILQKAGQFGLAAQAIDYFLAHPFNGRVYPEADNPGQILWIMGEHWLLARDKAWLRRVYPGVQQLAAMIKYYRTTPGPHWVALDSLKFGDALPAEKRKKLEPGRCDGSHPEYTEAFDIAGLWRAAALAQAVGNEADASDWSILADSLVAAYDARFGAKLARDYGSYCVLWPCRLYPLGEGKGCEQFKKVGAQKPGGWRYFPLATAHQGLLAGNREAGYKTLEAHLAHEQMQGWYVFDEGGDSGAGGWGHVRTTWKPSVAMPHGWAVAEFWLLMRDSLAFEDENRLVLLAGVPPEWLTYADGISVEALPTYFGPLSFAWSWEERGARLTLSGAAPPDGFVLRLPATLKASVIVGGKALEARSGGDFVLPAKTVQAEVKFKAQDAATKP